MRQSFKIPLQSEVEKYIKEKKNWPEEFCKYYAEKFYNFYMSNGWKVSGRAQMKDWKAAFNSQWQNFKFKEDTEMFNKIAKNGSKLSALSNGVLSSQITEVQKLDALLEAYSRNPTSINFESLANWYEYLKNNKLLKTFTREEVGYIQAAYNNDKMKCRSACVQKTFEGYINGGITFGHIINLREKLNGGIRQNS